MKDKWHWLRHNWTKWKAYNLRYRDGQHDIRQQRQCLICGFVQDELVGEDAILAHEFEAAASIAGGRGEEGEK